jgi:hypothetical protein
MLVLTADQQVRLTVAYQDRYGNAATIDGTPRWETSDDAIATVTPGTDGTYADVVTVGPAGTVQVRAVADAMPGESERLIIGIQEIEVVGGEARVVALTAGPASPKTDAPDVPRAVDEAEPTPAPAEESDAPGEGAA